MKVNRQLQPPSHTIHPRASPHRPLSFHPPYSNVTRSSSLPPSTELLVRLHVQLAHISHCTYIQGDTTGRVYYMKHPNIAQVANLQFLFSVHPNKSMRVHIPPLPQHQHTITYLKKNNQLTTPSPFRHCRLSLASLTLR